MTGGSVLDLPPMIYELKLGGLVGRMRETSGENTSSLPRKEWGSLISTEAYIDDGKSVISGFNHNTTHTEAMHHNGLTTSSACTLHKHSQYLSSLRNYKYILKGTFMLLTQWKNRHKCLKENTG